MSFVNSSSHPQSLLRRAVLVVGVALVDWAQRVESQKVQDASRVSPQELHRRRLLRLEAERRREEAVLRALAGPHQF